ncbi:MAG TPA: CPBP family intramembrane glutamic endopeptidase [Bryobacteraceae bacterium]|nr:CPBP family intramembrane glutamic endopeptidase [Bryobacteraceae bacterium]
MHTLVLAILLLAVLSFLCPTVQKRVRASLEARPASLFAVPAALTLLFSALAMASRAFSVRLALLVLVYTFAPVVAAFIQPPRLAGKPTWLDFAIILMLWLPLEFSAGQPLIPRPVQGFLHSVAYAIAILLGLTIFLGWRALPGMKFHLPSARDLAYGAAAFLAAAPVLIACGRLLGFIPPFHAPAHSSPGRIGATFGVIFVGTALPEEILFRSLIQNWLMQRFGFTIGMLFVAAFIFGCAHLDNGPQPLPNWRYMILATIAGIAYGRAFQKSSSVFSSVTCHALVDATKHIFF